MSDIPRRHPLSPFDDFVATRDRMDFYTADPFAQAAFRVFSGSAWEEVDTAARAISPKVSFRWRTLVERMASPERRPFLEHYDAYGNRVDRIVRPMETEVLEREVLSEGLFSSRTPIWARIAKLFLLYQLGEACIACPLVCTEGLIALLDRYADTPELRRIHRHCKEGIEGDFAVGAQFLSEIQGGSDVPANRVEAVNEGGVWRLYGGKFFCSAAHADYAVVTAKPAGSTAVAAFVMPLWEPEGGKEKGRRNRLTVDRLKWKMGTVELPTAEITLDGSLAYPVGPLDRGLANVVGIVLAYSRMTVGLSSAAFMVRAVREARLYAGFREAFGRRIGAFPLVARALDDLEFIARRSLAGSLKLYRLSLDLPDGFHGGLRPAEAGDVVWRRRFLVRELVMLQKITAAQDAPDVLRKAVSLFGGHGVMEDFSDLPRLFRDAVVNELWEGPRFVLLTQLYRDMHKARDLYPPHAFLEDLLGKDCGPRFAGEFEELLRTDVLNDWRECVWWDDFCDRLCHAFQEVALEEVVASREEGD